MDIAEEEQLHSYQEILEETSKNLPYIWFRTTIQRTLNWNSFNRPTSTH